MRGAPSIRLFFAFVPRSLQEGKRRNSHSRYQNILIQSDDALCAEAKLASIGVPVHRFGNRCKTFSSTLCEENCTTFICLSTADQFLTEAGTTSSSSARPQRISRDVHQLDA
jgi:hypothetical protein